MSPEKARAPRRALLILAVATSGFATFAHQACADTTATWNNASGGDWADAANWNPSTNYPNNGTPTGTNYEADITLPGAGTYVVAVDSNIAVDTLVINSANAIVDDNDTAYTLTVNALTIGSGTFELDGGTLSGGTSGATVTLGASSQFDVVGGTLDNLTFTGSNLSFNQAGSLSITNGLNLSGNTLNLTASSERVYFDGASQTIDDLSIDGSAPTGPVLVVGGPNSGGPVTLTLGQNATLHGSFEILDYPTPIGNTLINNGTIDADANGQTLTIADANFTNNATAESTNGATLAINAGNWTNASTGTITDSASTLTLGGTWSNAGTITTTGASTVNLGGNFTTAGLGTYTPSSGTTTNITGTLNNTGGTLTLGGVVGTWNLNGGTILGGTVAFGNNLNIINGTLSGATIASSSFVDVNAKDVLNLAGSWTNSGSINTTGTAVLNLGGTFTTADIGTLNLSSGTDVQITGTLDNSSSTFSPTSPANWYLQGGTILNGTLNAGASQGLLVIESGTLDGVQLSGTNINTQIATNIYIRDGITGAGQDLNVANDFATLSFDGPSQTLSDLNITDPGGQVLTTVTVGGPTTVGPVTLTISPTGGIVANSAFFVKSGTSGTASIINNGTINADGGEVEFFTLNSLTNNGTIEASGSNGINMESTLLNFTNNATITSSGGANLIISAANWSNASDGTMTANAGELTLGGTWVNDGTITATNTGAVYLGSSFTFADIGSLSATSSSSVYISGTLDNTGATLSPSSYGGSWGMNGGTIENGTLNLAGGNFAIQNGLPGVVTGTLSNVTVTGGDLDVTQAILYIQNGFTAGGNNLNLIGGKLYFDGPSQTADNVSIYGNNYMVSDESIGSIIYVGGPTSGGPVTLTLGPNAIIHGNTAVSQYASGSTLINNGVLNGDIYLEIRTSSLINNGLAEANGGTLDLGSVTLTNNGTLAVRNGGTIVFSGTLTGDGTLGGTGEIDGDVVLSADPSTLAFQIGGATQSTEYDYLKIVGTFALAGDLQVSFANSFQSSITSNEVFTVLSDSQPGGLSGSFLNVANGGRLETSDGYGSFLVNYGPSAPNSDEIVLSDFVATVPEPTSGALVLAAASLSLLRRRRPSA